MNLFVCFFLSISFTKLTYSFFFYYYVRKKVSLPLMCHLKRSINSNKKKKISVFNYAKKCEIWDHWNDVLKMSVCCYKPFLLMNKKKLTPLPYKQKQPYCPLFNIKNPRLLKKCTKCRKIEKTPLKWSWNCVEKIYIFVSRENYTVYHYSNM